MTTTDGVLRQATAILPSASRQSLGGAEKRESASASGVVEVRSSAVRAWSWVAGGAFFTAEK